MLILNHHHLYYFWIAAQEGSIGGACEKLHLAQPTVSAQIIKLEKDLGKTLLIRQKRGLELTEDGRLVFDYANQIFNYSQELVDALSDRPGGRHLRVQMAVVDQVSKELSLRLLKEVYQRPTQVTATVHEGRLEQLLPELKAHTLDLILTNSDVPVSEAGEFLKAPIGTLPVHFVASREWARTVKRFPQDLAKVPLLLPTRTSPIWSQVERFLNDRGIHPPIRGEIQDADTLRRLALSGHGAAPLDGLTTAEDLRNKTLFKLHSDATKIEERYWLIAMKRHRLNPVAAHLMKSFRI